MQPEGKGRDRIVICEDTDGDGAADKVTVFADKLSIPTSLTFANGGVIVASGRRTRCSSRTPTATTRPTSGRCSSRGWRHRRHARRAEQPALRLRQLDLRHRRLRRASTATVGGERHRFSQGFYRFKPDGSKLEFLRNTNNNSWGVGFSEEGLLFGSTANGNPSVYLPIPNRYYESVRGWSVERAAEHRRRQPASSRSPTRSGRSIATAASPPAAGHALYTARTYPKEYWNRTAFVAEPTGHLVATFVLRPRRHRFHGRATRWNLLASDDEWAAPIMAEVGPDGKVWVIDWYNFIVQHNPTPPGFKTGKGNAYETPLRDKTHGRIYRLVAKDSQAASGIHTCRRHTRRSWSRR